jgi:thioredoxin-dependent peroxiredoxin
MLSEHPGSTAVRRRRSRCPTPGAQARRRGFLALLLGATALGAGACGSVQRPDGGSGLLPVGALAPDLAGTTASGERVQLSSSRGHAAVVYFYPMDATPGCTEEACAFRDAFAAYSARGVTIFGVSQDSAESHREFSEHQKLPFPLVSDERGSVTKAYGVPSRLGLSARVTFLIDPSGRVARVWPNVDPGVHAREVLAAVAEVER